MKTVPILLQVVLFIVITMLSGCFLLPGGSAVDAALVTHTAGSSQHTAAVKIPAEPAAVYAAMIRIITADEQKIEVISRNDKAYMLEIIRDGARLTGQVTKLNSNLSDQTGRSAAISSVGRICDELGVTYEEVTY